LNRALREGRGDWVLSLDDDSCPNLDSWEGLAAALAKNSEYAAITCSVRSGPAAGPRRAGIAGLSPYSGFH
jgi:hypothetical protein